MVVYSRRGFTIIEVMLFLAVTGLMIAGILAGVGNNVRNQNYREGVNELRSFIQGQFDRVYNLTSDRQGRTQDPCSSGVPTARGMSSCLYVGRMLHFNEPTGGSGSSVTVHPVIAEVKDSASGPESGRYPRNIASPEDALSFELSDYRIAVWSGDESFTEEYDFNWQLTGYRPDGGGYQHGLNVKDSILILRSPVDGGVRSYKIPSRSSIYNNDLSPRDLTGPDAQNPGSSVLESDAANDTTIICMVDTGSAIPPATIMAVRVAGASTGPGDIEVVTNDILSNRGELEC